MNHVTCHMRFVETCDKYQVWKPTETEVCFGVYKKTYSLYLQDFAKSRHESIITLPMVMIIMMMRLWPDMAIYCYLHFGRIINNSLAKKIIMFAAVSFGWNYSLNGEYSPQCIFLTFGSDRKSVGRKVNHQHKFIPIGAKIWLDLMTFQMYSNALRHLIFVVLTCFETQRVLSYNMQVIKKDTLWSLGIRKAIFVIGKILGEAETNIYNQCNVIIICLHYYYN